LSADSDPALGAYYEKVFRQMYAAWNQPESLRLLPGLKTEILITVTRDGKITGRKMRFGSGNQLMDESVMKAVDSVRQLPPLPMEYRKPQEIIVTFVLGN
jgi:TonB family protein